MSCLTAGLLKEMNSAIKNNGKRILAVCCVVLIVVLQVVFAVPSDAAGKAGEELEIRVQYEGERGGKIRTWAVLSDSDLENLGAHEQIYTNITRVGTLMRSAVLCIELETIIDAAGIDPGSVKSFTFRTDDGYTMTFYGDDYLMSPGWYYPNLAAHSYRVDNARDGALQMEAGALDDGVRNAYAVIALKSFSTKYNSDEVSFDDMTKENAYRFFRGQTDLSYLRYEDEEGNEMFMPSKMQDITAASTIKYIYGIDLVLKGAPPLDGISLNVIGDSKKVGSQVQIQVTFEGDTFGLFSSSDVTWSSSDESVATVDKNGVVTILKEGEVTITAEAGGKTASVVLGSPTSEKDNPENKDTTDKVKATKSTNTKTTKEKAEKKQNNNVNQKTEQKDSKKKVITAREISIGKEIVPEPEEAAAAVSVKTDTQALEAVEEYNPKVVGGSAAAAVLACSGGAVFRVRRFRADMGTNIKSKH
ncbi:MAG: hypothetical protein E7226_01085 [Clostridiales bacterium]|nr:hypothetical protein [Clostridiales bacterium]